MNKKKRTILLASVFGSIPILVAGSYFVFKYSTTSKKIRFKEHEILEFNPEKEIEEELPVKPEKPEPPKEIIPPVNPPTEKLNEKIYGIDVVVEAKAIVPRNTSKSDKDIQNRKPYTALLVPNKLKLNVTKELIQKSVETGAEALKNSFADSDYEVFSSKQDKGKSRIRQIQLNWGNYYENKFYKYERLFMNENVVNFLTAEGRRKYPNIPTIAQAKVDNDKKIERFLELFLYFDYGKIKEVSDQVKKFLKEGLYIEKNERNVYINEQGQLDSHAFSPIYNTVTTRLKKDNEELRAFGFDTYWPISPGAILDNEIPGWEKTDDLSQSSEFKKYQIKTDDGIKIYKQIKKPTNTAKTKFNQGLVVDIDASNTNGYNKTKNLITQLKKDGKVVTQYRISNIGLYDYEQNFEDIMKALPDQLPQLTLILEGPNTKFLRHIENKKIDQLDLFTTRNNSNNNNKAWSINPLALRNVAWVNTNDYNSPLGYNKYAKIASRIIFNSLSFDEEDIIKRNGALDLSRINRGLRMAYYVRNNEGIFQGEFGNGLDPDHKEGGNSYPTELNLSTAPSLRSLRGLVFKDELKPYNAPRRLKNLTLYNNSQIFNIASTELNEAQFEVLDDSGNQFPPTKIEFSNSLTTNILKISGENNLTSEGYNNLRLLINYAKDNFGYNPTIYVDSVNSTLAQGLATRGYNVKKVVAQRDYN
ncbi:putative immunoglobulin-blocking virulence protein [Mycoplasma phocimorsus]|uniref:putative immunoglobulin-blocking virulence protein n=1 Tax=Mycoplasma phocimorsus TaxID=3045839 RepID=UPI0024BFE41B|nr:putative immunoglobulin-blocking virulence protein [Mycoplasma phocimorsus]MDJ1646587.1 putative immunoglobulin-blocking virulence protein [Mycoplasma phocimorsus]